MKKISVQKINFNRLSGSEKLAVAISSCVLAAVAALLCLKLPLTQNYPDFIVGNIAWNAGSKTQDLVVAPLFISFLFFGFVFLSSLMIKQKIQFGGDYSLKIANQLIWWSLPFFVAISGLFLGSKIDEKLLFISASGAFFIVIVSIGHASKKININPDFIGLTVFLIMFASLIPIEFALIIGRAPIAWVGEIDLRIYEKTSYIMAGSGVVAGLFYAIKYPEKLSANLPKLFLVGQIGLPIMFLTLYPARLLQPSGILTKFETTIWLKCFVVGVFLCGVYDVIRRYQVYSKNTDWKKTEWKKALSPIAIFAFLVGLKFGYTNAPHISSDDYHFGEKLIGWWSYSNGAIPYLEYIPAHGVIPDDFAGFLSSIFYDGTAGSIIDTNRIALAILSFGAFFSIYFFSGSLGLAFVLTLFLGDRSVLLFLTPFICLLFSRFLMSSPSKWLSAWFVMIPVIILGIPPQGLLLVAASGPMALYFIWNLLRYPEKRLWASVVVFFAFVAGFVFLTPLFSMLFSAIRYVLENGPINQVAYGIEWIPGWSQNGIALEVFRMSWIVIPVFCLAVIFLIEKGDTDKKNTFYQSIVVLFFVFLFIPYSMGRIDAGGLSRPGFVALFGWTFLLPIMAWKIASQNSKMLLVLLIACIGSALNYRHPVALSNFISSASSSIHTNALKDGREIGLPNIGMAYLEDAHWDRLFRLNALLGEKISLEETYLDLTSRNAQYFYLNRRPIVAVTAPYNMPLVSQQKRAVEAISENMPAFALLEGENIVHDGGGLALRNPYLYRFIIENYTPRSEKGFIVGYKKNQSENERGSDEANFLFQRAFSQQDLQKIPVSWGKSEKSLEKKMFLIGMIEGMPSVFNQVDVRKKGYKITGDDPELIFDISHLSLAGRNAGLLKFDFSCIGSRAEPRIQLFWMGDDDQDFSDSASLRFVVENGAIIVPVDASPYWLTMKHVKIIRIDLDDFSDCDTFNISNIGLFQRNF